MFGEQRRRWRLRLRRARLRQLRPPEEEKDVLNALRESKAKPVAPGVNDERHREEEDER